MSIEVLSRGYDSNGESKMKDDFKICPSCGSTEYLEDYPVKGRTLCAKCGGKIVAINLKTIKTEQEILDQCPFCGKEGQEDDTLFENDYTVIYKCTRCGRLDGYSFPAGSEVYDDGFISDVKYDTLSVKIAEQEGKLICPAARCQKYAKALRKKEKEHAPIGKCMKELNSLITDKASEMNKAGVNPETIKLLRWEVRGFLEREGPVTQKQLIAISAAALSLIQKSDQIYYKKSLGKKVTDCKLEKIFNVTRKTIRKWRKILQSDMCERCETSVEPFLRKWVKSVRKFEEISLG